MAPAHPLRREENLAKIKANLAAEVKKADDAIAAATSKRESTAGELLTLLEDMHRNLTHDVEVRARPLELNRGFRRVSIGSLRFKREFSKESMRFLKFNRDFRRVSILVLEMQWVMNGSRALTAAIRLRPTLAEAWKRRGQTRSALGMEVRVLDPWLG